MAGSFNHATANDGSFLGDDRFYGMVENLGDAYETIEEMHWLILYLAGGDLDVVREAIKKGQAQKWQSPPMPLKNGPWHTPEPWE